MKKIDPQTLIFFGTQGSGKGTQIQLFREFLDKQDRERPIVHVEMGSELRRFMSADQTNYTRRLVSESMLQGQFQPDFLVTYLLSDIFIESMTDNKHLIMDGYPRDVSQIPIFDGAMDFYKRTPRTIINITISEEESIKRLLGRGRSDDTEEGIRERLRWNRARVIPMIEQYRSNPAYTVIEIDGIGNIEDIHSTILKKLTLA